MSDEPEPSAHALLFDDADDGRVQAFFDEMGRALIGGDSPTLATLWETPALVIGDEGVLAVFAASEIEDFFAGAKDAYNERGVFDTRADVTAVDWATDRIAIVDVRWPWLDENGKEIGAEVSTYTLRTDERGRLRLRCAVMRGEDRSH